MTTSKLTEAQIFDKFADIVAQSLRIEPAKVTIDAHLMDDLGAESLDLIEITMETESAFDVWLPEKSILDTAAEVFVPDFLTVRSWVSMIDRLMQYTPITCEECGGPLAAETGFRMQCTLCQKQVSLRSGEDLNREWVKEYYHQEYLPSKASTAKGEPMSATSA